MPALTPISAWERKLKRTVYSISRMADENRRKQAIFDHLSKKSGAYREWAERNMGRVGKEVMQISEAAEAGTRRKSRMLDMKINRLRKIKGKIGILKKGGKIPPKVKVETAIKILQVVNAGIYVAQDAAMSFERLIPLLPKKEQPDYIQDLNELIRHHKALSQNAGSLHRIIEENSGRR